MLQSLQVFNFFSAQQFAHSFFIHYSFVYLLSESLFASFYEKIPTKWPAVAHRHRVGKKIIYFPFRFRQLLDRPPEGLVGRVSLVIRAVAAYIPTNSSRSFTMREYGLEKRIFSSTSRKTTKRTVQSWSFPKWRRFVLIKSSVGWFLRDKQFLNWGSVFPKPVITYAIVDVN